MSFRTISGSHLFLSCLSVIVLCSKEVSAQCTEGICGANALPDPTRKVFEEGNAVVTCEELEALAASDSSLCPGLANYAFYCGCPDAEPPCSLCGEGSLVEFPELDIGKYRPSWFPADETYDCDIAQKITSLESQCSANEGDRQDIATLCGCNLPERWSCTTICPDGTLVKPEFDGVQVIENHVIYSEDFTCGQLELRAAEGEMFKDECDSANYVGIKLCGCEDVDRSYCDLCEDGSVVTDLNNEVFFESSCFEFAGAMFAKNVNSAKCKAYRGTVGIYCGCNNTVSADGACRLCDDPGGRVVPDTTLFVEIGSGFGAQCGEMEFEGSKPGSDFTCEDMRFFGSEGCCIDVPAPTVSPSLSLEPTPESSVEPPPLRPVGNKGRINKNWRPWYSSNRKQDNGDGNPTKGTGSSWITRYKNRQRIRNKTQHNNVFSASKFHSTSKGVYKRKRNRIRKRVSRGKKGKKGKG